MRIYFIGSTSSSFVCCLCDSEAKTQSVPPYVIFHDATLREIAAARPVSLEELGQVKGVGASKLQRYGGRVLRLLGM